MNVAWEERVASERYELNQLDSTIARQHPEFQPYLDRLRTWLEGRAELLYYPGMAPTKEPLLIAPMSGGPVLYEQNLQKVTDAIATIEGLLTFLDRAPMCAGHLKTLLASHERTRDAMQSGYDLLTLCSISCDGQNEWIHQRQKELKKLKEGETA